MSLARSRNAGGGAGEMNCDWQLQRWTPDGDNRCMPKYSQREDDARTAQRPISAPFLPGSMAVVTLGNPRDKFWGRTLALARQGLSLTRIELASFVDFVALV